MSCSGSGSGSIFELRRRLASSAPSSPRANQSQPAKGTLLVCVLRNLAAVQEKEALCDAFALLPAHAAVKVRARLPQRQKAPSRNRW